MMAPCGIEIKVGQVWRDGRVDYTVMWVTKDELAHLVDETDVPLLWQVAKHFTNKRGGYRLVKDVPAKEATNDN